MQAYEHDCCASCHYLGTTGPVRAGQRGNATDHYICSSETLIQRYSSHGADYVAVPLTMARQLSAHWQASLDLIV